MKLRGSALLRTVSETIRVATIGDADFNSAKFTVGDRQIRSACSSMVDANEMKQIEQLRVTRGGQSHPLTAVASVDFARGPASITRFDRERRAVVGVDLDRGAHERGARTVPQGHREPNLPPSVPLQPSGDAEIQDEVATAYRRDGHWRQSYSACLSCCSKRVPAHHHSLSLPLSFEASH
jgi:multidrug efflux pump subunit AcrB